MKAKEVVKIINKWAVQNNRTTINYYTMKTREWGFAKRIGELFDSKLQLTGATYAVGNMGGFRYGYFTPYSFSFYKKVLTNIGDLSHERPNRKIKKANRET